jgi:hypothetical protein
MSGTFVLAHLMLRRMHALPRDPRPYLAANFTQWGSQQSTSRSDKSRGYRKDGY